MRVLYLHQYFASPASATGTRSYEFARRLIASGHEVLVITSPGYLPEPYRSVQTTTRTEIDGIPVLIIPVPYAQTMSFPQRIRAFIRFALLASVHALRSRADVIYATSTPLTIAIPGIAAKLWQRIPLVFEVRDLWPELPIALGALRNPVLRWLASALEWIAYHASAHIVALSPGMAAGVRRRGIPAERVSVIPNSSDVDKFDVPPERGAPIRARLGLAPGQPLILYAGTFGLINDVGYLVEVAAAVRCRAPDVRFLLIGDGADFAAVTARARDLGVLDETVAVWQPLPKHDMPAVFAAATVSTSLFRPLPEMWNNSANKFFDALAAGKPVAINYRGWQADVLLDSGAGLVLPERDPVAAARLLADFVRDPEQVQRAGEAAHRLAYTVYNRDLLARQLEAILKQVTG